MIDQPPYEITDGFKAAQEGLVFPNSVPSWIVDDLIPTTYYSDLGYVMPWAEVIDLMGKRVVYSEDAYKKLEEERNTLRKELVILVEEFARHLKSIENHVARLEMLKDIEERDVYI